MTKNIKILIWTFSITVILLAVFLFVFLYMISSNLRGPFKNENLSDTELNFVDSLKIRCSCSVTIEKDYKVETANGDSGTVYIELNYNQSKENICLSDSTMLLKTSKGIFHTYKNILTKRRSYRTIAINHYSSEFGELSETPTCDRTFYFDIQTNKCSDYNETNRWLRIKKQNQPTP